MAPPLRDRYEVKVDRSAGPDACHPWIAYRNEHGYGKIRVNGRSEFAHRVGWSLTYESDPGPLSVMHTCDNPPCQNPRHWVLGTHRENMADKRRKGRGRGGSRPQLSPQQHADLRRRYQTGARQVDLAVVFGIDQTTVSRYVRKEAPVG